MTKPLLKKLRLLSLILCIAIISGVLGCATKASDVTTKRVDTSTNARETKNPTPLDSYVYKPDPNYSYEVVKTEEVDNSSVYYINLTSQSWRKPEEVDRTIWTHWLTVVVPENVKKSSALLIISGGKNTDKPPTSSSPLLRKIAKDVQTVVAEIKQIPNQPLVFANDNDQKRSEDSIIAYNWDKYLRTGDAEWLTRLPMTKAVVRAMDTIQEFCASKEGGKVKIKEFVVAGASKRGWTTWTTTIVDNRVIACVPIVIDVLNLTSSLQHHYAVYGAWSPALNDYTELNIMDWLTTPEFASMSQVVDPYSYRNRLTMPKFIINSAGDEFFLPDSWKFYLSDLPAPTYVRYVPNTGHGLRPDVVMGVEAFYKAIVNNKPLPEYTWSFQDDCTVVVKTKSKPTKVTLWEAVNPEARDFRLNVLGKAYQPTELKEQGSGTYVGKVSLPEKGWKSYLIELVFPGPDNTSFTFTTPVRIIPDVEPHKYTPPAELPKGFLSK